MAFNPEESIQELLNQFQSGGLHELATMAQAMLRQVRSSKIEASREPREGSDPSGKGLPPIPEPTAFAPDENMKDIPEPQPLTGSAGGESLGQDIPSSDEIPTPEATVWRDSSQGTILAETQDDNGETPDPSGQQPIAIVELPQPEASRVAAPSDQEDQMEQFESLEIRHREDILDVGSGPDIQPPPQIPIPDIAVDRPRESGAQVEDIDDSQHRMNESMMQVINYQRQINQAQLAMMFKLHAAMHEERSYYK